MEQKWSLLGVRRSETSHPRVVWQSGIRDEGFSTRLTNPSASPMFGCSTQLQHPLPLLPPPFIGMYNELQTLVIVPNLCNHYIRSLLLGLKKLWQDPLSALTWVNKFLNMRLSRIHWILNSTGLEIVCSSARKKVKAREDIVAPRFKHLPSVKNSMIVNPMLYIHQLGQPHIFRFVRKRNEKSTLLVLLSIL